MFHHCIVNIIAYLLLQMITTKYLNNLTTRLLQTVHRRWFSPFHRAHPNIYRFVHCCVCRFCRLTIFYFYIMPESPPHPNLVYYVFSGHGLQTRCDLRCSACPVYASSLCLSPSWFPLYMICHKTHKELCTLSSSLHSLFCGVFC